jgi:sugar phosphate isomerase/epimerase
MAAPYGIRVDVEFMAWRVVATIQDAAALVAAAGKPNGAVLLDSVHLARSGGFPADIAGVPCKAAQICDGPLANPVGTEALIYEARSHRLLPGDGELPLIDFLRALPSGAAISAEVPMPDTDAQTKLNLAAEATRKIVALAA